jgi:hypothetical protein
MESWANQSSVMVSCIFQKYGNRHNSKICTIKSGIFSLPLQFYICSNICKHKCICVRVFALPLHSGHLCTETCIVQVGANIRWWISEQPPGVAYDNHNNLMQSSKLDAVNRS